MSEISRQEFQRRRQALVEQMQPGSAALIFAAPEVTRSADSEYPYRQNSDFWYFTGFNEPEAVLVLIKSDDTHNHSVLFNRVRDLTAEIWFGRRLGQDAAPEKLGVDRALAFSEINQQLYQLLNGLDVVYHAQGEHAYADEIVNSALEKLRKGSRQNLTAPATMIDWRPVVHEMRLFKSPEEIAVLRRAGGWRPDFRATKVPWIWISDGTSSGAGYPTATPCATASPTGGCDSTACPAVSGTRGRRMPAPKSAAVTTRS